MSEGLGLVNTKLPLEDNLETLRANGIEVSKKLLNIGATILKEKMSRSAQAITSTSFVALTDFQASVKCSGGLVIAWLEVYTKFDGAGNLDLQLQVDKAEKRTIAGIGLGANNIVSTPFMWLGELTKGNHVFKYYAKVNAGTQTVGNASSDSVLYIVEFNGGN